MPNVWELITNSSSLPIAPENNLWDHLNNLDSGGVKVIQIFGEMEVELMADLEVELEPDLEVELEPDMEVILEPELEVEICT